MGIHLYHLVSDSWTSKSTHHSHALASTHAADYRSGKTLLTQYNNKTNYLFQRARCQLVTTTFDGSPDTIPRLRRRWTCLLSRASSSLLSVNYENNQEIKSLPPLGSDTSTNPPDCSQLYHSHVRQKPSKPPVKTPESVYTDPDRMDT